MFDEANVRQILHTTKVFVQKHHHQSIFWRNTHRIAVTIGDKDINIRLINGREMDDDQIANTKQKEEDCDADETNLERDSSPHG